MNKQAMDFMDTKDAEFRTSDSKPMTFSGYAAHFGNVDSYGDIIVPGAFAKAVESGRMPAMLAQHGAESATPVGVFTSMKEDEHGLWVEGKLADTPRGRELYELMRMKPRPALDGMSIGFYTRDSEYIPASRAASYPEGAERLLKDIELLEVSLVTFPANSLATVHFVKSAPINIRVAEKTLREEGGFSAKEAKTILSILKKSAAAEESPDAVEPPVEPPVDAPVDVADCGVPGDAPACADVRATGGGAVGDADAPSQEEGAAEGDNIGLKGIFEALQETIAPQGSLTPEQQEEAGRMVEEMRREDEMRSLYDALNAMSAF